MNVSSQSVPRSEERKTLQEFAASGNPVSAEVYKRVDGQDLRLLICQPLPKEPRQQRPALVWIHGGGWTSGSPEQYLPHLRYCAARGAVGIAVQYRLMKPRPRRGNDDQAYATEKDFLAGPSISDGLEDCKSAMRYIRTHAEELGVDPERITVIGDSAGGHLACCLGTIKGFNAAGEDLGVSAMADAVIDCNGITDMTFENWYGYIKPSSGDPGDRPDPDRRARGKAVSPVFHAGNATGPFLIMQGGRDGTVNMEMVQAFHEALVLEGVDCELQVFPKARHAFIVCNYTASDAQITEALLTMDAFLVERGLLDGPTSIRMPDLRK